MGEVVAFTPKPKEAEQRCCELECDKQASQYIEYVCWDDKSMPPIKKWFCTDHLPPQEDNNMDEALNNNMDEEMVRSLIIIRQAMTDMRQTSKSIKEGIATEEFEVTHEKAELVRGRIAKTLKSMQKMVAILENLDAESQWLTNLKDEILECNTETLAAINDLDQYMTRKLMQ